MQIIQGKADLEVQEPNMIFEYRINEADLKERCYKCKFFDSEDKIYGTCICKNNKIKNRNRKYNSKACVHKEVEK